MAIEGGRPVNKQLVPHIIVKDVDKALDFYKRAFGATEVFRTLIPDASGRRHHAHVRIGESIMAVTLENSARGGPLIRAPETLGGTNGLIELFVDDVDSWVEQARAAGADIFREPVEMFFGDRYAQVVDPDGYVWAFSTPTVTMTNEECVEKMHDFYRSVGKTIEDTPPEKVPSWS